MFQKQNNTDTDVQEPVKLQPTYTPTVEPDLEDTVETVVGPSVHVEGDFASEGDIIVKGTVSGNVKTSRELRVESGAKIFASVHAGSAIISGEVEGDVTTTGKLEINATAVVAGDIKCDILAVAAGARIHGKVMMDGVDIATKKTKTKRTLGRVSTKKDDEDADA